MPGQFSSNFHCGGAKCSGYKFVKLVKITSPVHASASGSWSVAGEIRIVKTTRTSSTPSSLESTICWADARLICSFRSNLHSHWKKNICIRWMWYWTYCSITWYEFTGGKLSFSSHWNLYSYKWGNKGCIGISNKCWLEVVIKNSFQLAENCPFHNTWTFEALYVCMHAC